MAATAGIFAQCCTVACAVPAWVTARSCLLRTIFYPSLTCHNLGYWGTGLAVKSLFQFQKKSLEQSTCGLGCKFLGTKTVIQCLLVFSVFSTCPWGAVPVVPQLWFVGLQKSSTQLVGTSLLPLQIFHQGQEWVRCSWGCETFLWSRKFEKFFSKTCQINEMRSYFEMLGLEDFIQINLTILASEISPLFPRSGPRNCVHSLLETVLCNIFNGSGGIWGPTSASVLCMIISVVT